MLEKKLIRTLLCCVVALSFSAAGAMGDNILFIVNDPTEATYPNDTLIKDFLESLGHTVTSVSYTHLTLPTSDLV